MFKRLTEFSYKRSTKEAIGFYLAYFLVGIILGGISGALSGVQQGTDTFNEAFDAGVQIGAIVGIIWSLIIFFVVLIQRKLYQNFGWVILALLSGVLATFGGLLLGLILPSFLTTREVATTETIPRV